MKGRAIYRRISKMFIGVFMNYWRWRYRYCEMSSPAVL
jgi:hypothetical protein